MRGGVGVGGPVPAMGLKCGGIRLWDLRMCVPRHSRRLIFGSGGGLSVKYVSPAVPAVCYS